MERREKENTAAESMLARWEDGPCGSTAGVFSNCDRQQTNPPSHTHYLQVLSGDQPKSSLN